MPQRIIFSHNTATGLQALLSEKDYDKVFVLTDENSARLCIQHISGCKSLVGARHITIKANDTNKTLEATACVWQQLGEYGATRHSCMVNIGGGMVTDLGGFAASTYKRGIDFINIPTTLLAMVDASVGGKTGINFNGLKNEIGVFNEAQAVIIDTMFLKTLDDGNIRSGYAEMLKHSLLSTDSMWSEHLNFDLNKPDYPLLLKMIEQSVGVKEQIVTEDPHETGIRKALNFGHTIGHAFESFAMHASHPILHGYAVAYGMIAELYLSHVLKGLPIERLRQTVSFIKENYGMMPVECKHYDELLELMRHDKKNTSGNINFTLLSDVGHIEINQNAPKKLIFEALDFYNFNL